MLKNIKCDIDPNEIVGFILRGRTLAREIFTWLGYFNREIFYLIKTTISGSLSKLGPMRPFWKLCCKSEKYLVSQAAHICSPKSAVKAE